MHKVARRICSFLSVAVMSVTAASAGVIPAGYISWDVNFPGEAGQFDIVNLTGANSAAPTFAITTPVSLLDLNLVVDFASGASETFGPASGYFSLSPDGESFNGTAIPIGGTNPQLTSATLTGLFSPTTISDPGPDSILPTFAVTFSDSPNLVDGDLGVIYATERTVPEPSTWMLLAMGMAALLFIKGMKTRSMQTRFKTGTSVMLRGLLPGLCLLVGQSALGQVSLTTYTSPSSGVAGADNVNVTGSYFPAGTITPSNIDVTFARTCGGAAVATVPAMSLKNVLGSTDRVNVAIPTGLTTAGNYFVTIADSAVGDADFTTKVGSCSEVQVTTSSPILNACIADGSIGFLLPPPGGATGNVTAYVPKGYWDGSTTGIFVTNIEGTTGTVTTIPTPNITNSCSSNPATGQTVCVANNTDVYLITGTTLTQTLKSGSNTTSSFSGGECNNCGVVVNANNNTAVINMGITGGTSNSGVQVLNLNTNTFGTPFPMNADVSEDISVDPTRSLILSAGEGGNYTLLQIQSDGSLKEFDSSFSSGGDNDSSAEDCSTGIAISPIEFTSNVQLLNLNGLTLTTSPYTAPNAIVTLSTPGYGSYTHFGDNVLGPSAVAQGSAHLAVLGTEFGGNTFAVLKLPATAETGTPALVDYAVSQIPSSTACGGTFSAGFDPHTTTAYTSPNTGDSYAVFAGYSGSVPVCLAVVDMTTVINPTFAPRGGGVYGPHEVSPTNLPASAVAFFALH